MKKCPICNIPLSSCDYEKQRIMKCEKCAGYLVPEFQLKGIQRIDDIPQEELMEEVKTDFKCSVEKDIRCPKCHLTMNKQKLKFQSIEIEIDECKSCSLLWFDGGELALAQLGYEASLKFANEKKIRDGVKELNSDPERLQKFEENMSNLKSDNIIELIIEELIEDVIYGRVSSPSRM